MAHILDKKMVIGVSSRALFDLTVGVLLPRNDSIDSLDARLHRFTCIKRDWPS